MRNLAYLARVFVPSTDIRRAFGLGLGASAKNDDAKNASGMGRIAAAICHSINNLRMDFLRRACVGDAAFGIYAHACTHISTERKR